MRIFIMNKTRQFSLIIFMFSSLINFSAPLYAAPAPIITSTLDKGAKEDHAFGVGLTSSVAQRPFVGVENQSASLLYLSYKYKDFYIEGLDVGYTVFNNKSYNIDLIATPRFYEVEAAFAENGELNGIDKTRPSYFAGISTQLNNQFATYTFQILHDVQESDGNEIVLQASKSFKTNQDVILTPSVGLTYQDASLIDHYYGVQTNEIAVGRPAYAGQSSVNYNATLNLSWKLTKNIEMLGQVKYEMLGDGITDSPIVDENAITLMTLGILYRF